MRQIIHPGIDAPDAFRNPVEWLEFLKWLFRLEMDPAKGILRFPTISAIQGSSGSIYLIQSGPQMEKKGLKVFFEFLDQEIGKIAGRPPAPFAAWYVMNRQRLRRAGVDRVFLEP